MTPASVPENLDAHATLVDVLAHRAHHQPEALAYLFLVDGEQEEQRLTYAELDARARAIAASLLGHCVPGDRALLLYPPGLEFIAAFFGCLYAGVIAVPAYPPDPMRLARTLPRLRSIVADCQPCAVLTTQALLDLTPELLAQTPDLAAPRWLATDATGGGTDLWKGSTPVREAWAFLQYTSGSTASPKGVRVSHANLMSNEALMGRAFETHANTRCLGWLPLYHDMGLIGNVLHPLYRGLPCVLMSPLHFLQRPARWLQAISRHRATLSGGPNFAYDLCVRRIPPEQRGALDLSCWETAFNGAEPIQTETLQRFVEAFAPCGFQRRAFFPCYGLAEATLFVTGGPRGEPPEPHALPLPGRQDTRPRMGSGQCWDTQRLVIVEPETRVPCPDGQEGEIWLAGPSVADGYWNRPEETAHTFQARLAESDTGPFLRTGDLGLIQGGRLFVTGRRKDLIILRGQNHYPQDIESTVERSHPALRPGCTVAFAVDADDSEQLVVVQEVRAQDDLAPESIVEAIRLAVSREHELSLGAVVLLAQGELPKTSSGKIQRRATRTAFLEGTLEVLHLWRAGLAPRPEAPTTPTRAALQQWLLEQLATRLHVSPQAVDVHAPFARFGLDSKEAVALSGALEQRLGRRLSPTLLYAYPTVDKLAAHLTGTTPAPEPVASTPRDEPIAVIGLGCRFPGAPDPEHFWRLLHEGREAIRDVPPERWSVDALYSPRPTPGKTYTRAGGFLDAVDRFDPAPFGISDAEARSMDPQQRLLLEVAWEALEHAGLAPDTLVGSRTGVFVGISSQDYTLLHARAGSVAQGDPHAGTGTALSTAAGRLSYVLGLQGPSLAVDTACSSSLVALHLASQSLQRHESDLALAAGVNLLLSPEGFLYLSTLQALSPDGRCKTFSASADGYGRGEGCGVVVLKRLADALADGDTPLAVLRGSAINHDGPSNGLTAPNGQAQQAVIRAALERAGCAPRDVDYVEAHGTGTALGDPIELSALAHVRGDRDASDAPLWVGSVKTNIGHLEAAAGIAGLIKVVLSLEHEELPAHLHAREPSPHMDWERLPLAVPHHNTPWRKGPRRRLAGVSSFGLSGTNAHVVVEEAPPVPRAREDGAPRRSTHLVRLSAMGPDALRAQAARLAAALAERPDVSLAEVAARANTGRAWLAHRATFVASAPETLRTELERFAAGEPGGTGVSQGVRGQRRPTVAFLFTGQGSQFPGMGRALYETEPTFRAALERCEALLRPSLERPLLSVLYPAPGEATPLEQPSYAQPALFAVEYALAETWRAWGIEPAVVVGHSLGEYAAAVVAGVLDLEEAARLTAARGRLMQERCGSGIMAAVIAREEQLAPVLAAHAGRVSLAAMNGPDDLVLSGEAQAMEEVLAGLRAQGLRHRRLRVSHAFHSPLMDPMLAAFEQVASGVRFNAPRVPMISSLTGTVLEDGTLGSPAYWRRQLREPVLFGAAMDRLVGMSLDVWLEIGPQPTLLGLARRGASGAPASLLPSLGRPGEDWKRMLESLGALHVQGAAVEWKRLGRSTPGVASALPTYAFQRRRFWLGARQEREPSRPPEVPAMPVPPPPKSPTERRAWISLRLRTLMAELLAVEPSAVDAHTPLVDLGVDSLVLIDGLQRIQREFHVPLSLRDVFERMPTLDALATHLADARPTPGTPEPVRELTPRQRAHLDALIDRYTRRTPTSQARRRESQTHLADTRASAGFRSTFPAALRAQWHWTKAMCYPLVGVRSEGARFWDADGNAYVDFAMGFGVHLFGHAAPWLTEALQAQLQRTVSIGPQADHAAEAARLLCALTGVERVAFCGSGTEAVMTALRLARGVVGRPKVALFSGSYHGSSDGVLGTIPMTHGAPPSLEQDVLVLEYGHPRSLELIREHADALAAVLVEPVQGRRPEFQPRAFLQDLRALTREKGIALVFDEVLVGFRCHQGGAQALFGIQADLVTYGKIIGGGMPIGVVAGQARFLDAIDGGAYREDDDSEPGTEPVWFAGTFNKNPLAMAAAVATLRRLRDEGPALQERLNARTAKLAERLNAFFQERQVPLEVVHFGSLFRFKLPRHLELFFFHLLSRGIYVWEGRGFFLSTAHTDEDVEALVTAVKESVQDLREGDFLPEPPRPERPLQRRSSAPVLVRPQPRGRAQRRLLCFPFAGAGTTSFRRWAEALPHDTELGLVQLPGRETRSDEPLHQDFTALVDQLEHELHPYLDVPTVFFGHSMGALLGFALARRLRRRGAGLEALFVSGEPAPHLSRPPAPLALETLSDEALLTELARHGVTRRGPGDVALLQEHLPVLRADLKVCASYRHGEESPLACPLAVFGGREDPLARRGELAAWAEHTQGAFSLHLLPGDHFFLQSAWRELLGLLSRRLEDLGSEGSEVNETLASW
ncbi:aminotransferase class III-fold pyridoxal phosphate-dependent enzyme [Melittangium boletus]|uniref:aminotransferase class III-fold pyridoxal phosphate-dependent enzyme n=1 Tax=Melittangium boletus TaxID=83453 RepID=UPI003DA58DBC